MKSFIFYDSYSILQRSNKNILCLLVIVLCNIQFSFSQENSLSIDKLLPDFNHLTPEAASLGKYGTIAMTEYLLVMVILTSLLLYTELRVSV